jgi:hypothetical protein
MVLDTVLQLAAEAKKVDELCAPSKDASDRYRQILKELYDGASASSAKQLGPLLQLTVSALDDESIWEQLQTRNNPLLRFVEKTLKRLKKRLEQQSLMEVEAKEESEVDEVNEESDVDQEDDDDEPSSEEEQGSDSDDADFDEERDDYVEESDGDDVDEVDADEGEDDAEPLDENDRMEAWLDREDELEMDRQYRAEKRGGRAEEVRGERSVTVRYARELIFPHVYF